MFSLRSSVSCEEGSAPQSWLIKSMNSWRSYSMAGIHLTYFLLELFNYIDREQNRLSYDFNPDPVTVEWFSFACPTILCLICLWVVLKFRTFRNNCFVTFHTGPMALSRLPHPELFTLRWGRAACQAALGQKVFPVQHQGIRNRRCGSLSLQACVSGVHSEEHTLKALFVLSLSDTHWFRLTLLV